MPYILVRASETGLSWQVKVTGLKASDVEQMKRFHYQEFGSTIVYLHNPSVILTALEVLGYKVVAASSCASHDSGVEYTWTMRTEFLEPEPESELEPTSKTETMTQTTVPVTEKWATDMANDSYYYIGVKGSPFATDSTVFGLSPDEILALSKRFPNSGSIVVNGVSIKGPPFSIINALAELGYRVVCSTGEAEILWTLQREV